MADKLVSAFTDESGNTGMNVFDINQPFFFTLTCVADQSAIAVAEREVLGLCNLHGVKELHGSVLGVGGIEQFAPRLRSYLESADMRFILTVVEKRHMAAMKLADAVLDSGINPAVGWMTDNSRPLRIMLSMQMVELLHPRDVRRFWKAQRDSDLDTFRDVLKQVVADAALNISDERAKLLLRDALNFGVKHPENLLQTQHLLDSPNAVALSLVLHTFHQLRVDLGYRVEHFIHDEQNQFMKAFGLMYSMLSPNRVDEKTPALIRTWSESDAFAGPLLAATSRTTPMLQLVDVLLWLVKRQREGSKLPIGCAGIVDALDLKCTTQLFTRKQLELETATFLCGPNAPLPKSALHAAKRLHDALERRRQIAIKNYANKVNLNE